MASSPSDNDRIDAWLAGMSDEAKADVLKSRCHEQEETRRQLSDNETQKLTSDTWQTSRSVRAFFAGVVAVAVVVASGIDYSSRLQLDHDIAVQRLRSEHPESFKDLACPQCPACVAVPR